jgi:hypothetical protein
MIFNRLLYYPFEIAFFARKRGRRFPGSKATEMEITPAALHKCFAMFYIVLTPLAFEIILSIATRKE